MSSIPCTERKRLCLKNEINDIVVTFSIYYIHLEFCKRIIDLNNFFLLCGKNFKHIE